MTYQSRISKAVDPSLFVGDEFDRMVALGAFEDMRAELVAGRIERMAPASGNHGRSNFTVAHRIKLAFADRPVDIATDLLIDIDEVTRRALDIAISTSGIPDQGAVPADQLILGIEISDTTLAKDLGDKARDYARAGLPHYWVVDLKSRVTHVMDRPEGGQYASVGVVRFDEPLVVPGADVSIILK